MKRRKKQILPDNRISSVLIALILPILFFVFWVLGSHQAWFHSSIIPTPHKMWVQLTKMLLDRSLWNAIVFSFRRVLFGYLLGAASWQKQVGDFKRYHIAIRSAICFYRLATWN